MKKLLLVIAVSTIVFGCKKDDSTSGCYDCTTTMTTTVSVPTPGYPQTSVVTQSGCDGLSPQTGTTTATATIQGISATTTTTVVCQ